MLDRLWSEKEYRERLKNITLQYEQHLEQKERLLQSVDRLIFYKNFHEAQKFLQSFDDTQKLKLFLSLEEFKNLYLYEVSQKEESLTLQSKGFEEVDTLLAQEKIFIYKKESEKKISALLGPDIAKKAQFIERLSLLKEKITSDEPAYLFSLSPLRSGKKVEVVTYSSFLPQELINIVQFAFIRERTDESR